VGVIGRGGRWCYCVVTNAQVYSALLYSRAHLPIRVDRHLAARDGAGRWGGLDGWTG